MELQELAKKLGRGASSSSSPSPDKKNNKWTFFTRFKKNLITVTRVGVCWVVWLFLGFLSFGDGGGGGGMAMIMGGGELLVIL